MKGITWRIIPVILVALMLAHVAYYLYANTGEIIYSAKIYRTIHKMDKLKELIKQYSQKYQDPAKLKTELVMMLNSDKNLSLDPWGNNFIIKRLSPTRWLIISKGKDKMIGTKDDITTIFRISSNYGRQRYKK